MGRVSRRTTISHGDRCARRHVLDRSPARPSELEIASKNDFVQQVLSVKNGERPSAKFVVRRMTSRVEVVRARATRADAPKLRGKGCARSEGHNLKLRALQPTLSSLPSTRTQSKFCAGAWRATRDGSRQRCAACVCRCRSGLRPRLEVAGRVSDSVPARAAHRARPEVSSPPNRATAQIPDDASRGRIFPQSTRHCCCAVVVVTVIS